MAGSSVSPYRALRLMAAAWGLAVSSSVVFGQATLPTAQPVQPTATRASARSLAGPDRTAAADQFVTSNECLACHNGMATASGEDVSIGVSWRSSMMANAGRDPYWMASVRREVIDHPSHRAAIEDECSVCHMPMARASAVAAGGKGEIFSHLSHIDSGRGPAADVGRLAADGVSCALCHQITAEHLGTPASYTGGFVLGAPVGGVRPILGPYDVTPGHTTVMRSATGFQPTAASHLRGSELCATCHTLITEALGADGQVIGRLPEQMPYQEWQHSAFREEKTCQQCHMPTVDTPAPITSVFGAPRDGLARHTFVGGNFFMLRLLNRHRTALDVQALPQELEATARATIRQLQGDTATLRIARAVREDTQLRVDVQVSNLTGHKLPTGYPARRTWIHLVVRDASGQTVFESGAPLASGAIQGNDNDDDGGRVEPHREVIRSADEVQIYESVMGDIAGVPTTGLLAAVRFLKDNRLLPRGFDKSTAAEDIAVRGAASSDDNFNGAGDRVSYEVPVRGASRLEVVAELCYQPIGFRWARNLRQYDAPEPQRFVSYYDEAAGQASTVLARSVTLIE